MALPDLWRLFGLRSSPFFQDTLQPGAEDFGRYPLELFVGRARETERLLGGIGGGPSSRQIIQGAPGIGKTTLVQHVKERVARERILSDPEPVGLAHADSADVVLIRILSYVYEAILAGGDFTTPETEPMVTARQIVRAYRVTGGGASISLAGIGGLGGSVSTSHVTPASSLTVMVPQLLVRLSEFARTHCGSTGVLVHINNLDNLTSADLNTAAAVVRDIRDSALMVPGYHFILVGTPEAIRTLISAQAQVRSVFAVSTPLAPLPLRDVWDLLRRRYEYLRLDERRPVTPPVTDEVVEFVYDAFQGDLRGTLRALDAAAHDLIGYGAQAAAPMTLSDVVAVLKTHYHEEMVGALPARPRAYLADLGASFTATEFSQSDAAKALGVSQATVSQHLGELMRHGYVVEAGTRPGRGRPESIYRLAGPARLIFGAPPERQLPDAPSAARRTPPARSRGTKGPRGRRR